MISRPTCASENPHAFSQPYTGSCMLTACRMIRLVMPSLAPIKVSPFGPVPTRSPGAQGVVQEVRNGPALLGAARHGGRHPVDAVHEPVEAPHGDDDPGVAPPVSVLLCHITEGVVLVC